MSDWSSDVCSADLLARARRRSVILGKGVDEQDMLVESIQRRVEQKVSPRSDLALARSRAAQVRQQLATTKAERQSALMRVFQFVGDTSFDPGTVPIYDAAVSHPDPAGAFDQALACRPRSEERRGGKECVSKCRSRWAPYQ